MALSPSYAPAFQPASEIGPGVRSATVNAGPDGVGGFLRRGAGGEGEGGGAGGKRTHGTTAHGSSSSAPYDHAMALALDSASKARILDFVRPLSVGLDGMTNYGFVERRIRISDFLGR